MLTIPCTAMHSEEWRGGGSYHDGDDTTMNAFIGRYSGWVLEVAGLIGGLVVAYEAITLPFLRGAGLAQADFELFVLSCVVGVPAIVASAIGALILRRQRLMKNGPNQHLMAYPAVAIVAVTALMVVAAAAFALLIRRFGFFWM